MRVTHVIDSLAPSGAERSNVSMVRGLVERGVEVELVTLFDREGLRAEAEASGARVVNLAGTGYRAWAAALAEHLRAHPPDLVHTTLVQSDLVGRWAARRTAVPVVSSLVNVRYGSAGGGVSRAVKTRGVHVADAVSAQWCRRFHAVSETVAAIMARRLRLDPSRIDVVLRGRDPEALGRRTDARRAAARALLDVGDRPVLVAVSRHEPQKGIDVLLRAMADESLDDALLLVVGRRGSATPELERLARAAGGFDRVRFLGVRADVPDLLCAADVFVLPSRWEGLPGALLEAIALEVPVVASDLAAVREVVRSGLAVIVPPDDPANLAAGIVETLRGDPRHVAHRVEAARRRFLDRFTVDAAVDGMVAFYERARSAERVDAR